VNKGRRIALVLAATLVVTLAALTWPWLARSEAWPGATWQNPYFLLGLALVPVVWWWGIFAQDRRRPRLRVGTVAPLVTGPRGLRTHLRDLPGVLRAVAVGMLVLAMGRPVSVLRDQKADDKGIDIVVVMDLSGSMRAVLDADPRDLPGQPQFPKNKRPTRLDVAKLVVGDFIGRRQSDRIGVVVFGKSAYVLSPPTLDYHLLDTLVSRMELNLIDGGATAIGDALGVAVARLRRSHAASKAIVLLTDGDNNAGRVAPEYSAHLASVVGAKVYTIQIGSGEMSQALDGFDLFGQPHYVTKSYPTNPELLRKIAQQTGGRTYVATDARALQASLHDVLNQLEKTKFESTVATFEDLYRYLLLPGVLLIAIEAFLRSFVLRRFP
jgi:Ca-activated chloride channel family protein